MSVLKDSGARREFSSGAVRDIQEGKGRCDLLPLDVISVLLHGNEDDIDCTLNSIAKYVETGDTQYLYKAIYFFCDPFVERNIYTMVLDVAKHYEDGAKKYEERNWEKGIDLHCFIDSGVRHYLKYKRGDKDEPHDRAFVWNMLGAIWTHKHRPERIDLPFNKDKTNEGE